VMFEVLDYSVGDPTIDSLSYAADTILPSSLLSTVIFCWKLIPCQSANIRNSLSSAS
jgi:hypothetical protein